MVDTKAVLGQLAGITTVSQLAQREPSVSNKSIIEYNLMVIENRISEIRDILRDPPARNFS